MEGALQLEAMAKLQGSEAKLEMAPRDSRQEETSNVDTKRHSVMLSGGGSGCCHA